MSSQTLLQNYLRLHQPAAAAGDQAVVRLQVLSQWAAATEGTAASAGGDSSQGDDADDSDVYGTVLARGGSEEAATIKVTMPRVVG